MAYGANARPNEREIKKQLAEANVEYASAAVGSKQKDEAATKVKQLRKRLAKAKTTASARVASIDKAFGALTPAQTRVDEIYKALEQAKRFRSRATTSSGDAAWSMRIEDLEKALDDEFGTTADRRDRKISELRKQAAKRTGELSRAYNAMADEIEKGL